MKSPAGCERDLAQIFSGTQDWLFCVNWGDGSAAEPAVISGRIHSQKSSTCSRLGRVVHVAFEQAGKPRNRLPPQMRQSHVASYVYAAAGLLVEVTQTLVLCFGDVHRIIRKRHHPHQVWEWPTAEGEGGAKFYDADSFRSYLLTEQLDEEARALLPRDLPGVKPIEKPAEAALRLRMCTHPPPPPPPAECRLRSEFTAVTTTAAAFVYHSSQ